MASDTMLSISLSHIDIRSMETNIVDFENLEYAECQFSIIGVGETWLNDVTSDLYGLDGYELIERHLIRKEWNVQLKVQYWDHWYSWFI